MVSSGSPTGTSGSSDGTVAAAAVLGSVGSPVTAASALPLDSHADVDPQHPGEDRGRQFRGELEQGGRTGLAGTEPELAEPFTQPVGADRPAGLSAGGPRLSVREPCRMLRPVQLCSFRARPR